MHYLCGRCGRARNSGSRLIGHGLVARKNTLSYATATIYVPTVYSLRAYGLQCKLRSGLRSGKATSAPLPSLQPMLVLRALDGQRQAPRPFCPRATRREPAGYALRLDFSNSSKKLTRADLVPFSTLSLLCFCACAPFLGCPGARRCDSGLLRQTLR